MRHGLGLTRAHHLKPRPGVWPDPLRKGCRFVTRLGSNHLHPAAEQVASLHDELSQATSGLPIA